MEWSGSSLLPSCHWLPELLSGAGQVGWKQLQESGQVGIRERKMSSLCLTGEGEGQWRDLQGGGNAAISLEGWPLQYQENRGKMRFDTFIAVWEGWCRELRQKIEGTWLEELYLYLGFKKNKTSSSLSICSGCTWQKHQTKKMSEDNPSTDHNLI